MALDKPAAGLMELGLRKRDARELANLLRDQVARDVRKNIPDVEYSAACGVLIGARPGLVFFLPRATQAVLGLGLEPVVNPALALASLCPIGYLDPVIHELLGRAMANPARDGKFSAALSRRPAPSKLLQDFRRKYTMDVSAGYLGAPPIDASTADLVGDQLRSAIAAIPDRSSHARAKEWTGWALLAALNGLETYDVTNPMPPKRKANPLDPVSPLRVYRTAFNLLMGGALSLIDEAQG